MAILNIKTQRTTRSSHRVVGPCWCVSLVFKSYRELVKHRLLGTNSGHHYCDFLSECLC